MKFLMRMDRDVQVGLYLAPGWDAPRTMYRFRCPKHGWVVNHPGPDRTLACPLCETHD